MSHLSSIQPWLIHNLETCTNGAYNQTRSDFCNAAEYCNWERLFSILEYVQKTYHESWVNCPTSEDGWAPLHYAAYENTPISIVNRLLGMGAWRSVHTVSTAGTCLPNDRMTAFDIAKALRHNALCEVLRPVIRLAVPENALWRLQIQFHRLICDEMSWSNDRDTRLPELSVLREGNGYGWFPVQPGVNGEGYLYRLSKTGLLVWSCSENGSLEVQCRVTEVEYVEVEEDDYEYNAAPWAMINNGRGGADFGFLSAGETTVGYESVTETDIVYDSNISTSNSTCTSDSYRTYESSTYTSVDSGVVDVQDDETSFSWNERVENVVVDDPDDNANYSWAQWCGDGIGCGSDDNKGYNWGEGVDNRIDDGPHNNTGYGWSQGCETGGFYNTGNKWGRDDNSGYAWCQTGQGWEY